MKKFKYTLALTQEWNYSSEIQASSIEEASEEIHKIMHEIPEERFQYLSADTEMILIEEES